MKKYEQNKCQSLDYLLAKRSKWQVVLLGVSRHAVIVTFICGTPHFLFRKRMAWMWRDYTESGEVCRQVTTASSKVKLFINTEPKPKLFLEAILINTKPSFQTQPSIHKCQMPNMPNLSTQYFQNKRHENNRESMHAK